MSTSAEERKKVFVSYSHRDREWLERLQVHLRPLERRGLVELWDDTKIRPGDEWRKEIGNALDSAKVAVLLISADFLQERHQVVNLLPDREAATLQAAMEYEWSNGRVEVQINRLKMVKRIMFGQANLDLLKARVLNAA